jgi:hypothetical protein
VRISFRFHALGNLNASTTQPKNPVGAILRHMKVEEIAEAVAKLPPDRPPRPHVEMGFIARERENWTFKVFCSWG